MTSEADDKGKPEDHWQELLGSLGITPAVDDSQPQPATPPASSGTPGPPPRPASAPTRQAPATPRRPQSDWGALASSLGLEVPVEPDEPAPQPLAPPPVATARIEPTPAPAAFAPEVSRPREAVERRRTAWESPDEVQPEQRPAEPAARSGGSEWREPRFAEKAAEAVEADEPRLEDLPGYIEPPMILDDSDTLTEMFELRDESESDLESDDERREPAVRRRRRRRGRRERPGDESRSEGTPEATDEVLDDSPDLNEDRSDFGETVEAETETEAAPDRETEESETGFRRRRRRRRRGSAAGNGGRSEERRPAAQERSEPVGDTDQDDEPEPNWDELDEDDDEGSRGREGSGEPGAPKHHKIPTWEQAISIIVDANLQSRSRSGGSSRGGGGGGHGGPRGRRRGRR